jgi:membrane protein DedA with SNARE-associated domain
MLYSFLGSFLWGFVGVFAGNLLTQVFGKNAILIIFGLLLVSVGVVVYGQFRKNKNKNKKQEV